MRLCEQRWILLRISGKYETSSRAAFPCRHVRSLGKIRANVQGAAASPPPLLKKHSCHVTRVSVIIKGTKRRLRVVRNLRQPVSFSRGGSEQRAKYAALQKICRVSLINSSLKAAALQFGVKKNKDLLCDLGIGFELQMKENRFFFFGKEKNVSDVAFLRL